MQTFDTPNNEGAAAATDERPGGTNGTQDTADSQSDDALNQPADGADSDGGGEAGEAGEDAQHAQGEAESQEGDTEPGEVEAPPPFDPSAFEQNLLQKIEEKLAGQAPAEPARPQLTEEQWAQKEEEFGMNRRAIERTIGMLTSVHDKIMAHIEERFARIEKDSVMSAMSKKPGFADASRYKAGMDEFLSRYAPSLHNNPELLEQAYYYAKGKAAGKNIQRARQSNEVNRRIAGPARPASPAVTRRPGAPALNKIERDTAARFGMSDAEYAKYKVNGKTVSFS